MPLEPGQKLSHYRLVEKIGEGGMGVVWKARDDKLRRDVALKVLPADLVADPERRRRLVHEARAEAAVDHPYIASVFEVDEADGVVFVAMELVRGKSLRAVLEERALPVAEALRLATEVAEGLAAAHAARVVHRDLKPENVMVRPDGHVKILDFGLAKVLEEPEEVSRSKLSKAETLTDKLTRQGRVLGTAAYMSPEQARGEPLDVRTDIFSFGSMLYEVVAGKAPFGGRSATDILSAILRDKPPAPSSHSTEVPGELDRIIGKCLEKEPRDRYQHTSDLAVDLRNLRRAVQTGAAEPATPSGGVLAPPREKARARRRSWRMPAVAGSAALVIALLTLVVWQVTSRIGPGADPGTLLILPLEVREQEEGADYVGLALAEAIAVNLAQARDLKVLPVPEAVHPRGIDPLIFARDAGAGLLLTGTITRDGIGLQARIKILDTIQNRILWGSLKDTSHKDLTRLAAELAAAVAEELGIAFRRSYDHPLYLSGDSEMAASSDATAALEAWSRGGSTAAIASSERLVRDFPTEVGAHALHAFFLTQQYINSGSPEDRQKLERVLASLDRVDPANPYGDFHRVSLLRQDGDLEAGQQLSTSLLARNDLRPGFRAFVLRNRWTTRRQATFWLNTMDAPPPTDAMRTQALAPALADLEEAVQLDPGSAWSHLYLSWTLQEAGRSEEALAQARQATLVAPSFEITNKSTGLILASLGRWEESLAFFERAVEIDPWRQHDGMLYAISLRNTGREVEAQQEAARAATLTPTRMGTYFLARYWALAGDPSSTLRFLRDAVELGFANSRITYDTEFGTLRGNPEFEAIVAEVEQCLKDSE